MFLTVNEIRERFFAFFERKGHLRLPSFSLIPYNDNSLLIINAGMAPLKPYFTGQQTPPNKRVVTSQKCVRTIDIDEVGLDARHFSFFEMLGNFSFGDYFKEECIPWAWEFLTAEMGIPAKRLYVTVYLEDNEAAEIWVRSVGLKNDEIARMGKEDNYWELDSGPCGPCSEIHYDRGAKWGCGNAECRFGADRKGPCEHCERYMELWNLVFTQFNRIGGDEYTKLDTCNIDTGMSLERLALVVQDAPSVYAVDNLQAILDKVCAVTGVRDDPEILNKSLIIITDHARSVTFMAGDGILPSNEGRGYVLRRLLRRAVRHGKLLGRDKPFLSPIIETVIDTHAQQYLELSEKRAYILRVLEAEERKFYETLETGMALLHKRIDSLRLGMKDPSDPPCLSGADAFRLYDTYGFPLELMREIMSDEGLTLDEDGFNAEMEGQRARGRAARAHTTFTGVDASVYDGLGDDTQTEFVGYDTLAVMMDEARVVALAAHRDTDCIIDRISEGEKVSIVLSKTPFYAESGGQKGDAGVIKTPGGTVRVEDCVKAAGGKTIHTGTVICGTVSVNEPASATVDGKRRLAVERNHSATHLLQKALREVLGEHIEQAGSEVSDLRLRFDFSHYGAVSPEELSAVEARVNEMVLAGLPVTVTKTDLAAARHMGATMLFGEKYGDLVRVVDMGGYSVELCGGTHLRNTRDIGLFKIVGEGSAAAGIRRIEALTGEGAISYYKTADQRLRAAAVALKTEPEKLAERIKALQDELKSARQEIDALKSRIAGGGIDAIISAGEDIGGIALLSARLDGMDAGGLRTVSDKLRDKCRNSVIVLCGTNELTVQLLICASDEAVKAGVHAGNIIREAAKVVGGNGGGKPGTAQAGGKDTGKANEALALALDMARAALTT